MSPPDLLEQLFDYVGFDDEDAKTLVALRPHLEGSFERIVDDFYAVILRTPSAAEVFRGGEAQIERQKTQLRGWLRSLFGGTYDAAYLERRSRIGRAHVRIRLEQKYMFGAMNVLRRGLHRALRESELEAALRDRGHVAIDRICDVELAVMLESYRDRYVEEQRARERVATVGHLAASIGQDLRNPLAVIATSTHLLRKHVGQAGERHLDKIERQVHAGERTIGDLLALAGAEDPHPGALDLATLARDVRDALTVPPGVELRVDVDPELPDVSLDGDQIRQVLFNLLSNALEATEEAGGSVELSIRLEASTLLIDVLDDGPGFPAELVGRRFEPLFTTAHGSVGLGLALCTQIVAKHGGTIEALDRPGGGAHVRVQLPSPPNAP